MTEIWKPIEEYGDMYEVSDAGRVRNYRYPKVLTSSTDTNGYQIVTLYFRGKGKTKAVHQLVAHAFLGPQPGGMQVNHIDEDKTNNAVSNLEYVTSTFNNNWGTRTRRAIDSLSKPVTAINLNGDREFFPSIAAASQQCDVSRSSIRQAIQGRVKTVAGCRWELTITPLEVDDGQ